MDSSTTMLQSAVRLPTPPLDDAVPSQSRGATAVPSKRKASYSDSPPPPAVRRRHVNGQGAFRDVDPDRGAERERQFAERQRNQAHDEEPSKPLTEAEKQEKAKEEYQRLLNMRSGGTYIPPARLRALQAQVTDKTSKEYQRMAWEALKKSINGLINKVNVSNIKHIVPELFSENLVRGRGLFCRSIMKAQAASLPFTPIYAAMVAIVNTKLPQVGELLMNRLIVQFRKAYKRNDKTVCLSSTTFIAHLCNNQVIHELLAAHMLQLLLSKPTDDSVEIAVGLTREVGQQLEEMSGPIAMLVFDQFRNILHEADIDKRTQYMIEVLFQVRKDRWKENPAIREELDLVEEEDQITHKPPGLDEVIETEDGLNIFKYDADFEEHEEAYKRLKAEILGEGSDDEDDESGSGESETDSDDEEAQKDKAMEIKDQSNTDLTNLRRTIYLTINSSADFEECAHKLMKINLPVGQEAELPSMVIETCSQRPTYEKFYGLIGERFARLNRLWTDLFEQQFVKYYDTIHRYETNRLRNIARFFGHILSTDAIGWHVMSVIHLNEEETTSSSRIFIKILFQDLAEAMGMKKLQERIKDETLQPSFAGLFPMENPRNTRFSINYFTSIGMGAVTEPMREYLKNMPKPELPPLPAPRKEDESMSDTESHSSRSSYSSSYFSGSSRSRSRSRSLSGSARSISRSRSRSRSARGRSSRGRARSLSYSSMSSRSRSPDRRRRGHARDEKTDKAGRRRSPSASSVSRSRSRSADNRRGGGGRDRRERRRRRSYTPSSSGRSRSRSVSDSRSPSTSRSRSPAPRRGGSHTKKGREMEKEKGNGREWARSVSSASSSSVSSTSDESDSARSPSPVERASKGVKGQQGARREKNMSSVDGAGDGSKRDKAGKGEGKSEGRDRGGKGGRAGGEKRERSLSPYSRRAAMQGRR